MTSIRRGEVPSAWRGREVEAWAGELGVPALELAGVIPSTNDRLRNLADGGAPPLTTVIAGAQTRGRGRSGRGWHSPPDSGLWMSILLAGEGGAANVLPLAVGVAAARALERFSPLPVSLKWPNDLLFGDQKVAGILCEAAGDGRDGIVVGIGVNLRRPLSGVPDELAPNIAFLEEVAGGAVREPSLARVLVGEIGHWARPAPRSLAGRLRAEWEARDCLTGRPVHLENGIRGIARGVSKDGSLELVASDGRALRVRSGSVRLDLEDGSLALHAFNRDRTIKGGE